MCVKENDEKKKEAEEKGTSLLPPGKHTFMRTSRKDLSCWDPIPMNSRHNGVQKQNKTSKAKQNKTNTL